MRFLQHLLETTEHVISVGSIPALQPGSNLNSEIRQCDRFFMILLS